MTTSRRRRSKRARRLARAARHDELYTVVHGALRSAIHDHGPIYAGNVESAVKRVVGQIRNHYMQESHVVNAEAIWRRKYRTLQHGHQRAVGLLNRFEPVWLEVHMAQRLSPEPVDGLQMVRLYRVAEHASNRDGHGI